MTITTEYEIVKQLENSLGQTKVIVSNGENFFVMTAWKDGTYTRQAGDGLTLQTRDFNYAALGAKTCKTLKTAISWAKQ